MNRDAGAPLGTTPPGPRLPDDTRLGPVRLQVADLGRTESFYSEVLGLQRVGGDGAVGLGPPGAREPLVEIVARPGARALRRHRRLGLYHYALLVPDRAALGRFALHAGARGVRLGMSDHEVSEALYLHDPDGLGIEVYADRPRSTWETADGQLVMSTRPLDVESLLAAAQAQPFDGLSPGTVVGHVHLHVADIAAAARFYHEGLGFAKTVWNYPGALFLSAGGYHHHVGLNTWATGAPPAGEDDAKLLSWTLVHPDAAAAERLATTIDPQAAPGPHGGWLVTDPWGTAVEIVPARGLRNATSSAT